MASEHASRARNIGRSLMGGGKGTAIALATGAVAGAVSSMLGEQVPWFQKYWYAMPVAIGLVGHAVKQTTSKEIGSAALGSAGTMAYYNWKLHKAAVAASGGAETSGVQDTRGPIEDYVQQLRSLPDTAGVQPRSAGGVMSMRTAA